MTTFETLKECEASLIIEEYEKDNDYTKSINIIFDKNNNYKIKSYREEIIKKEDKLNRLIFA